MLCSPHKNIIISCAYLGFLVGLSLSCHQTSNNFNPIMLECGLGSQGTENMKIFRSDGTPYGRQTIGLAYLDRGGKTQRVDATEKGCFKLPSSGEYVEFESELPEDLQKALPNLKIAR